MSDLTSRISPADDEGLATDLIRAWILEPLAILGLADNPYEPDTQPGDNR
jgi:hypothetical protein